MLSSSLCRLLPDAFLLERWVAVSPGMRCGNFWYSFAQHWARLMDISQYLPRAYPMLVMSPAWLVEASHWAISGLAQGEMCSILRSWIVGSFSSLRVVDTVAAILALRRE